jgi:predicted helicase
MTYQWFNIYNQDDNDHKIIIIPGLSSPKDFFGLSSKYIIDLNCLPAGSQCLPLYTYNKNGNRIENITDWGLQQFREYYSRDLISLNPQSLTAEKNQNQDNLIMLNYDKGESDDITKKDIFDYIYAVLHNPEYRKKYELNLKREFPRIPFYDDFWQWVNWGKKLMELHLNYENVAPYQLKIKTSDFLKKSEISTPPKPKLKADKIRGEIILDDATILTGIPQLAWEYKLGNRSALEWILDQYKEKKPKDPTIAEKFNHYRFADYKKTVIDLLMRVTTVSVETMKIINQMTKTSSLKNET